MNQGRTVFSQVLDPIHPQQFQRCVARYQGEARVRTFSCWEQFLAMAFAQITFRESLRDIVDCLNARPDLLYHLGFRNPVRRSTLADANEQRDWRIYADLAQRLIAKARLLYQGDPWDVNLTETAYAFDSTTIDLCLNLFPWARMHHGKGGVKLHTLLDLRGSIPAFLTMTDARTNDLIGLDRLVIEPGSFYVMDRGYTDFARLYRMHCVPAYFVTRAKRNFRFCRQSSRPIPPDTGLRSDQIVRLVGRVVRQRYPEHFRRIRFFDEENHRFLIFLTNHLQLPALTVCQLYKARWRVELFFRWIKQHLRIKSFYGTSENAVQIQIWIAVCTYVLVAIVKKQLKLHQGLHSFLQVLSVHPFEKVPIIQLLTEPTNQDPTPRDCNQKKLFDF